MDCKTTWNLTRIRRIKCCRFYPGLCVLKMMLLMRKWSSYKSSQKYDGWIIQRHVITLFKCSWQWFYMDPWPLPMFTFNALGSEQNGWHFAFSYLWKLNENCFILIEVTPIVALKCSIDNKASNKPLPETMSIILCDIIWRHQGLMS